MNETQKTPKVFISYSWSNPKHEDWVVLLAERLMSDGVEVVIDKWNLKEGHDKYHFMESMVNSVEIDKVLLILDKKYSERADEKTGGVGTETQIISPEIYSNVSQEKFIPIIAERDDAGKEYMPTYLRSRIYIDLCQNDHFEINYEKLLRNIFKCPALTKPTIGKVPDYLFQESVSTIKTAGLVRRLADQIERNPGRINQVVKDFFDAFIESLKKISVTVTNHNSFEVGKQIVDNLNSYTKLRDDYIHFFDKLSKEEALFEHEIVIRFLEKLPQFKNPLESRSSWSNWEFDNYRFIIHELFIYTVLIAVKNESFKLLEELFNSDYIIKDKYQRITDPKKFGIFYNSIDSFDTFYKQTFSKNLHSPMADFLIKRVPENLTKAQLIEADLICHYIADLNNIRWFPLTYVYKNDEFSIELFSRLVSRRHFEKIKTLFNVTSIGELKKKFQDRKTSTNGNEFRGYSGSFESITPVYQLVEIEKIGSIR